jgi:hypothetical protein
MSNNGKHIPPDQDTETIKTVLEGLTDPTKQQIEEAIGARKSTAGKKVIPIKTAIPAALKKLAAKEHRDWKNVLRGWIDRKSRIQWYQNGSYQFLLPPPLIKLVWQVTLQERIKYIKLKHKGISDKDAAAKAVESVNAELAGTAKTIDVIDQTSEQVAQARERKASEEEAEAGKTLARYREDLVKKRREEEEGA